MFSLLFNCNLTEKKAATKTKIPPKAGKIMFSIIFKKLYWKETATNTSPIQKAIKKILNQYILFEYYSNTKSHIYIYINNTKYLPTLSSVDEKFDAILKMEKFRNFSIYAIVLVFFSKIYFKSDSSHVLKVLFWRGWGFPQKPFHLKFHHYKYVYIYRFFYLYICLPVRRP